MSNSRSLTPLSTDTNDLNVLTAVHLTLVPLTALTVPEENNSKLPLLQHWRLLQKLSGLLVSLLQIITAYFAAAAQM